MRARRKLVVASLLLSFIGALWLSTLAFETQIRPTTFTSEPGLGNQVGTADGVDQGARVQNAGNGATGMPLLLMWLGALVSAIVFLASFLVFRVEVRHEKDTIRARKTRSSYARELKQYNAQLKGPPRHNT